MQCKHYLGNVAKISRYQYRNKVSLKTCPNPQRGKIRVNRKWSVHCVHLLFLGVGPTKNFIVQYYSWYSVIN